MSEWIWANKYSELTPMLNNRLKELGNLEKGWCDGEGEPGQPGVFNYARQLLERICALSEPVVGPTIEGGLDIEWSSLLVFCTLEETPNMCLEVDVLCKQEPNKKVPHHIKQSFMLTDEVALTRAVKYLQMILMNQKGTNQL